ERRPDHTDEQDGESPAFTEGTGTIGGRWGHGARAVDALSWHGRPAADKVARPATGAYTPAMNVLAQNHSNRLIALDEPGPVEIVDPEAAAPFVITGD